MSKLSKKLLMSVLTLVLTLAALGTTTFAWFTLGNEASVGQIDTKVTAGDGLEIQLLDKNGNAVTGWYNALPANLIAEYIEDTYKDTPLLLTALTSENGVDLVNLDGEGAVLGQFLELKFNLRSVKKGTVKLDEYSLTSSKVAEDLSWTPDIDFVGANGDEVVAGEAESYYVSNAARFSVQVKGETSALVYENASTVNGNTVLGSGTNGAAAVQLNGAHYYYTKKGETLTGVTVTNGVPSGIPTAGAIAASNQEAGQELFVWETDGSNAIPNEKQITLRLWLEGWDADTFNSLFEKTLSLTLSFVKI